MYFLKRGSFSHSRGDHEDVPSQILGTLLGWEESWMSPYEGIWAPSGELMMGEEKVHAGDAYLGSD